MSISNKVCNYCEEPIIKRKQNPIEFKKLFDGLYKSYPELDFCSEEQNIIDKTDKFSFCSEIC